MSAEAFHRGGKSYRLDELPADAATVCPSYALVSLKMDDGSIDEATATMYVIVGGEDVPNSRIQLEVPGWPTTAAALRLAADYLDAAAGR